ncbi:MAG: glycosyltransferase family 8 protein [Candidatus Ventricola sp.]
MNILVTLDRNYLTPLCVMLTSLLLGHPGEQPDIYVAADGFTDADWAKLRALCAHFGAGLRPVSIDPSWFEGAPTIRYYSRAMYYRLLAAQMLPDTLDRILYLDPDLLITGSLRPLYDTDMGGSLYAAAIHSMLSNFTGPVNRIRLSAYETEGYYNSGVLLMNLPLIRRDVHAQEIFAFVRENRARLVLPDQDILNGLYGERILPVDEYRWNYDARRYSQYLMASQGVMDMDWVMANTSILHFCGKRKPWKPAYSGRFAALYKHYMHLSTLYTADQTIPEASHDPAN